MVRSVDERCIEAERDTTLDRQGIACRRTEIGTEALRDLTCFKPFEVADKAAKEQIISLERQPYRAPEEVQTYETLRKARADLREGVEATKRMVLDRCKMR